MKIFISSGGPTALRLAVAFKKHVLKHFVSNENDVFVSQTSLKTGSEWFGEITEELRTAEAGLVILCQSSLARQWVNFEAGALYNKLGHKMVPVMSIHSNDNYVDLGLFKNFKGFDGSNREQLLTYLSSFVKDADTLKVLGDACFENWSKAIKDILKETDALENSISRFNNLYTLDYQRIRNSVYKSIISRFLHQTATAIAEIDSKFEIQAESYPHYIIELQNELRVNVKAIALHDHFERFWDTPLGDEIAITISQKSMRIFVFEKQENLEERMFEKLLLHAKQYGVFVMSFDVLSKRYPLYAKDFSIITSDHHKIHGEYKLGFPYKTIVFSTDFYKIADHEKAFDTIQSHSIEIEATHTMKDLESIRRRVFNYPEPDVRSPGEKTAEMSKNINITDYEKHEEEHAYYLEMLQRMLSKIDRSRPIRILEIGAGTGNLTKRLLQLPGVKVEAVEYDEACFARLQANLKAYEGRTLTLHFRDGRIYNPPGKFDYIVSSFTDHHIAPANKYLYFSNVIANLEKGGRFIVGDEFLGAYTKEEDRKDYIRALKAYHNHIIGIAFSRGQTVLASLEQDALDSGINEKGDFKISTSEYEKHLEEVGFVFTKELIGPEHISGIGGVYVYTMHVA